MHTLCSQMLTVVLHFLSSTFCMPPKKTSPPHFVQALFFLSPHHLNSFFVKGLTSMSELNAFPSHVFCNSIKLFSLYWQVFFSFSFSSEKKMQWFCSCVPMLSMKISARKLHSFSWRKNQRNQRKVWWFAWPWPQPLLAKQWDCRHPKPAEAELNSSICRETITCMSSGTSWHGYYSTSHTACQEFCPVPNPPMLAQGSAQGYSKIRA